MAADTPSQSPTAPLRARVLLIDDEPQLAKTFGDLVRRRHDFVHAPDGAAALALLARDSRFDIIFCDLMMPKVSGMDVFAALSRSHPELAARFHVLTGGAFTSAAERFLQSFPPAQVIEKPFEFKAVLELINKSVQGVVSSKT